MKKMEVKDLTSTARKFVRNATAAASEYRQGVEGTSKDQAASAIAAKESWELGIQGAISDDRFSKGLQKSGHSKWRDKASGKGARNYPSGVGESESDYREGFAPYHSALEGITLPPRGPRGAPQNIERVRIIADRLHAVRVG